MEGGETRPEGKQGGGWAGDGGRGGKASTVSASQSAADRDTRNVTKDGPAFYTSSYVAL